MKELYLDNNLYSWFLDKIDLSLNEKLYLKVVNPIKIEKNCKWLELDEYEIREICNLLNKMKVDRCSDKIKIKEVKDQLLTHNGKYHIKIYNRHENDLPKAITICSDCGGDIGFRDMDEVQICTNCGWVVCSLS